MPLHPQAQAMRDARARANVAPLYTLSVARARAEDLAAIQAASGEAEPVAKVVDRLIDGPGGVLPLRLYRPATRGRRPVLMYFFGGGWTLGTIDTADAVCRRLANAARCLVVGVEYRLAPEHKFPAAVYDCHAATRWVAANAGEIGADPQRIAVGGDSAGGNLAAAVTLLLRDEGDVKLVGQLLVYPNTDHRSTTASMRDGADPYLFNSMSVAWYWKNYLRTPKDGLNPLASPLRAPSLAGLPPALVITAEFDPLRDQAEEYARRLAADGVPVALRRFDGMVHGFFCMAGELDDGRAAQDEAARKLRSWFFRTARRAAPAPAAPPAPRPRR